MGRSVAQVDVAADAVDLGVVRPGGEHPVGGVGSMERDRRAGFGLADVPPGSDGVLGPRRNQRTQKHHDAERHEGGGQPGAGFHRSEPMGEPFERDVRPVGPLAKPGLLDENLKGDGDCGDGDDHADHPSRLGGQAAVHLVFGLVDIAREA